MPGTQRAPGGTDETSRGHRKFLAKFLAKPWWVGIGVFVAVLGVIAAILVPLLTASSPPEQHPTQSTSAGPIQFSDLNPITIRRYGFTFFYPSNWDQSTLPGNGDGTEFVNPEDTAVTITGFGTHGYLPLETQRSMHKGVVEETGATAQDANGTFQIPALRFIDKYVNESHQSMTVMIKETVANGREVVLEMAAPTGEFDRYKEAFLELGNKLLLFTKCEDCSS